MSAEPEVATKANGAAAPKSMQLVIDWPNPEPEAVEAIVGFWKKEGAFNDEAVARKRVVEVVLHALTPDGAVAGVCTAVPVTLPRLGQPMYYYRSFVGKAYRSSRLVLRMLKAAQTVLEAHARTHRYPCIGMLIELENTRFTKTLQSPVWTNTGFVFIGKSRRGFDMRVCYFRGAKLKKPF